MAITRRLIDYRTETLRCQGMMILDSDWDAPRPAVMVAPTWAGRDAFACGKAEQLAQMGYIGFALDPYGGGRVGDGPEENGRLMQPLVADRGELLKRTRAGLAALRTQPEVDSERVAAMGFCFGGLCVLDLARSGTDVRGVVSFHGLLMPPDQPLAGGEPVQAKLLILHGHDDPMAPMDQVVALGEELTRAGADWQIHLHGGTVHAFTNPLADNPAFGTVYNPVAARRSWQACAEFITEVLN